MTSLLSFVLMTAVAVSSHAENLLDRLYDNLSSSCVEMEYTYMTTVSGASLTGYGRIWLQGDCWKMTGNGIDMWCDGSAIWAVDNEAMEVVIEGVAGQKEPDIMSNPATLFTDMHKYFYVKAHRDGKDGSTVLYMLHPSENIEIEYVNLELKKSDASLVCGTFAMKDGNDVRITVSSMKTGPLQKLSSFRPDVNFDADWIVTDMR